MSASEQLVPLSDADRQLLSDRRSAAGLWALGSAVVAVLLAGVLVIFPSLFTLIMIGGITIFALTSALAAFLRFRSLSTDLRAGQKEMVTGPVEAQDVDVTRRKDEDGVEGDATYTWWIQIGRTKVTVTEDQYYQFRKGDMAQAFIGPKSRIVLGLSKESLG